MDCALSVSGSSLLSVVVFCQGLFGFAAVLHLHGISNGSEPIGESCQFCLLFSVCYDHPIALRSFWPITIRA